MTKVVRCIYCEGPCKISEDNGKHYMDCPNCGKKELTKLGKARFEARETEKLGSK